MNTRVLSAYLAILFAIGLAGFETLANWGDWQWWPFWLIDYAAAALLLAGGICVVKKRAGGANLLCAGWGFALAMLWMSLAGNLSSGLDTGRDGRLFGLYLSLTVFSIALSFTGLVLSLFSRT